MAAQKPTLQPQDEVIVEKLQELVSNGLKEMEEIWGERPYLRRGRILFEQRRKRLIPVVEIYCVLGGQYRNGNFYEAFPLLDQPGRYTYSHKLVRYNLLPFIWCKAAEKHLVEALRKVITEESDKIPSSVFKLMVKEGPRSLRVLCQLIDHKTPTLALVFTPALEGSGWPEQFEGASELAKLKTLDCLLVPPVVVSDVTSGWELTLPGIEKQILSSEDCTSLHTAMLFIWLAERRGWAKLGLSNPSMAVHSVVFNLAATISASCLHDQLKSVLDELQKSITAGSLNDICVPALNYLQGISAAQQEALRNEMIGVVLELDRPEGVHELFHEYPLPMPETKPLDLDTVSQCAVHEDEGESEDSVPSGHSLHEVEELDEGGGGEGCFKDMPPPLDVKDFPVVEDSAKEVFAAEDCELVLSSDLDFEEGSHTLPTLRRIQSELGVNQNARVLGTIVEIILLIIFFLIAMREVGPFLECLRGGGGCPTNAFTMEDEDDDELSDQYGDEDVDELQDPFDEVLS